MKLYLLSSYFFLFSYIVFSQNYNISNSTINTCSGNFYDTGGPGGNYGNNQNIVQTFCSTTPGEAIQLAFSAFNVENNFDFLIIYDGPTTGSPVIGSYTGGNSPGTVSGSGSCITVQFTSDGSVVSSGWAATISCVVSPPPSTNINMTNGSSSLCSGMFYDSGGSGGNYGNNQNFTYTICPDDPNFYSIVDFTSFATENCCDFLTIYDGPNTGSPSLGTYNGLNSPGTVSASPANTSGCLMFVFTSDGSVVNSGWVAAISCGQNCQIINSVLNSVSPAPDGDGVIRVCQGESITFNGSGTFSNSGVGASYQWNFGDGNSANGTSASHSFNDQGAFLVNLNIIDVDGCTNNNLINQVVQVSTTPLFVGASVAFPEICLGETNTLIGSVTPVEEVVECTSPVSGQTFLPDGSGVSYETSVSVDCFGSA